MISQTSPFLTAFIAWLWLREVITQYELFAMFGSYLGIAMIGLSQPPTDKDGEIAATNTYKIGILLSLVAAVGMSIIATSTRKLKEIHFGVIQFIYATSSTLICLLIVAIQD